VATTQTTNNIERGLKMRFNNIPQRRFFHYTKHDDYASPVIHLECLENDNELSIAMQILGTFEGAGVSFGAVFYNVMTDEINVHTYNMGKRESMEIYREVKQMPMLQDYNITLN
jgi:hypothetical protein